MRPIIVIPARMQSSRFPDKPLALIAGEPMIVHVWRRGVQANLGPVIVASGDDRIAEVITRCGGIAVATDPDLPSGSDRVASALDQLDPSGAYDTVINLQGDMPCIDPTLLTVVLDPLDDPKFDLATLACPIRDEGELARSDVVKVAMERDRATDRTGRAIYFSRSAIPHGAEIFLHHIGLYAYKRQALARFVAAPRSALEAVERLEQLRALSIGLSIAVTIVDAEPLGVDTAQDLGEAKRRLGAWQTSCRRVTGCRRQWRRTLQQRAGIYVDMPPSLI